MNKQKKGIIIAGHGSKDPKAATQFKHFAKQVADRCPDHMVNAGFLEFSTPTIEDAILNMIQSGITQIIVMPLMLMAARHIKDDIPSEINHIQAQHPEVNICYGTPLDIHPKMLMAAKQIIENALIEQNTHIKIEQSLLLVVGRGALDADANSNICKITRMLWEGTKCAWAQTAFSGSVEPQTEHALNTLEALGFKQIIVFPYFLFCGKLIDRIYKSCENHAQKHPTTRIIKTPYFNDHPFVIDTFMDRLAQVQKGQRNMNCQLCHYREQIIGYEDKKGQPQTGHHHHVKGIGTDHHHE